MIECDVYIATVFLSLYRNWNLEPCLKIGDLEIYGNEKKGNLITIQGDLTRLGISVEDSCYCGDDVILEYLEKTLIEKELNMIEFQDHIGYRFTLDTKQQIYEMTASEGLWFLKEFITIQEYRM